ncbi:hypothetical protein PFICI_02963 [Pestalotiopsis fici W106-1]|uniref:Uncharacterized protein n=1 Tax=Pestalotiopsis fici (strain W106-1 / CGMCC3.15140) TaxID=1229662 RepID=W3XFQ6_PESFW|nr:uncharacterized protein PFICI_02963 [Pestalotiopsis fici W106-1]ETS84938.1 hypothetical protein PFICI_02963 [Pestalotiopsis fici W106-1]
MVAVHADCYTLFEAECQTEDRLKRLWVAIRARKPWANALSLQIAPPKADSKVVSQVYHWATACGIPGLKLLPPEIIRMIADFSEGAAFFRCIAAVRLGRELKAAPQTLPLSMAVPLRNVLSWTRGEMPKISPSRSSSSSSSTNELSFTRLTYDRRGIRRIENSSERETGQRRRRTGTEAYTVVKLIPGEEVLAAFEYGILRLKYSSHVYNFYIWDIPDHPDINCLARPLGQEARLRTIDLQKITGLTFFYNQVGRLYWIHGHTTTEVTAKNAFDKVHKVVKSSLCWTYVPIAKGDRITAIGLRLRSRGSTATDFSTSQPAFVFRTQLAGDFAIGPQHDHYVDHVASDLSPSLLIYKSMPSLEVSDVGAHPPSEPGGSSSVQFRPLWADKPAWDNPGSQYFSAAPLGGVTRMQIFQVEECYFWDSLIFSGILFDYENGAQRAVGECLVGVAPSTIYMNPKRICVHKAQDGEAIVNDTEASFNCCEIEAGSELEHDHGEEHGWFCYTLEGYMSWWHWADGHSNFSIAGATAIPRSHTVFVEGIEASGIDPSGNDD